jgi:hypothetical protein
MAVRFQIAQAPSVQYWIDCSAAVSTLKPKIA